MTPRGVIGLWCTWIWASLVKGVIGFHQLLLYFACIRKLKNVDCMRPNFESIPDINGLITTEIKESYGSCTERASR